MNNHHKQNYTRRDFLRTAGVAIGAGLLLEACQPKPSPVEMTLPAPKPGEAKAQVSIAQIKTYDRELVNKTVAELVQTLGGLKDIVKSGDRVAIKTNLTGGLSTKPLPGTTAIETYITHPLVVGALVIQVFAAGAKEVFIVESAYEWASFTEWGYEEIAKAVGATLINMNDTKPYTDYCSLPVGSGNFIYSEFTCNQILKDVDVFMSVAKMKNHYSCGVTHTMKNLVGMVPAKFYEKTPGDGIRSGFHGTDAQLKNRLPRVVVDLNRARPIHFSLIDGIMTTEAGEGPWINTMTPIKPGVLIAGKNAVASDAVATAVMGFDPTGNYPDSPFLRSDNHLNLANAAGLGTNKLNEIEILGTSIDKVRTRFTPCN